MRQLGLNSPFAAVTKGHVLANPCSPGGPDRQVLEESGKPFSPVYLISLISMLWTYYEGLLLVCLSKTGLGRQGVLSVGVYRQIDG